MDCPRSGAAAGKWVLTEFPNWKADGPGQPPGKAGSLEQGHRNAARFECHGLSGQLCRALPSLMKRSSSGRGGTCCASVCGHCSDPVAGQH